MGELVTAANLAVSVFAGLVSIHCAIVRLLGAAGVLAAVSGLNVAMFVL